MNLKILGLSMNQESKGMRQRVKGRSREEVGKLRGNKTEEVKGKIENTEGKARQKIGRTSRKARI